MPSPKLVYLDLTQWITLAKGSGDERGEGTQPEGSNPKRDVSLLGPSRGLELTDSIKEMIEEAVRSELVPDTSHEIVATLRGLEHVPTESDARGFGALIKKRFPFSARDRS